LALLATEGTKCTEAAGGQVAAQAAPSPELLALLKLPAGAPAPAVRATLNTCSRFGDLPIHHALGDTALGPELVLAMLDAGGEAMLGVPGLFEHLPLHRAAMFSRSPAVVALLLARGPAGSARAGDEAGRTPLHFAERHNAGPGAEEIKVLLEAAMW
jgi:ankyrin repeat protein